MNESDEILFQQHLPKHIVDKFQKDRDLPGVVRRF